MRRTLPPHIATPRRRAGAAALVVALLVGSTAGVVAVSAPGSAQDAPATATPLADPAAEEIAAVQAEKATRTPDEAKVDSNLLYAANEEAGLPAVEGAPSLTSTAEVDPAGRTEVDIAGTVDAELLDRIEDLGGRVVESTPEQGAVRALLPVEALVDLAGDDEVRSIAPAAEARTNAEPAPTGGAAASATGTTGQGAAANEAVVTHGVDQVRARFGIDGTGVKACVLSDGVDTLAGRQASGDLPAVDILPGQAGSGDEGTAMLELIHDMAPGAELGFATAFGSQAGFAQNVIDLRAAGCDVIVDDVTYYTEGAFQDDDVARAISQVRADGAVYFTSAGNSGNLADGTSGTWQGDFQDAGVSQAPLPAGLRVHGWGVGRTSNVVTSGFMQPVTLQWADPLGASRNDYDLFVLDAAGTKVVKASTTRQTGTQDPYERVEANNGQRIVVAKAAAAADRYLAVYTNRGMLELATGGASYGHNASEDAVSVAATPAVTSLDGADAGPYPGPHSGADVSETFSSDGPARTFHRPDGTALTSSLTSAGGVARDGVDLTGADGTSTTAPMFRTFFGTSAAAPNVASLAVLALSADASLTPDQVEDALAAAAVDVEAPGRDPSTGAGIPLAPALMSEIGLDGAALVLPGARTITEAIGDGDDVYEPGEVFEVAQELVNRGAVPATDVTATLSTPSSSVAVTTASAHYGTLAAGETAGSTVAFRIRILKTCVCGRDIPLALTSSYGGGLDPSRTTAFGLTVGTAGPSSEVARSGEPLAIPDLPATGAAPIPVSTTITVGDIGGPVRDLAVAFGGTTCSSAAGASTVGLTHSYVGDLEMTLVSPAGTAVALTTRTSNSGNNLCRTVFTDRAAASFRSATGTAAPYTGSYQPASPLAAFAGEDARGTWTLRIADARRSDSGILRDVALRFTPASCDLRPGPAPTAAADELSTPYQTPLRVDDPGVLGNDTDVYGDGLEATLVDDADHGTLELAEDGTLAYTPDPGFSGIDTFRYTADDAETASAPAVVTIDVGPAPNAAPTARPDAYGTGHDGPLTVAAPGVLGNDDDAEGDPLTVSLVDDVDHGRLELAPDGSFTYAPDDAFAGEDTFTYTAEDDELSSPPVTVAISVTARPNTAPTAGDDAYRTEHGTELAVAAPGVLADDGDAEGDPLTAGLVDDVDHGDLDLAADGSFTYTPGDGFAGDDTFTYVAGDGLAGSTPATVTITVAEGAATAPVARGDVFATPQRVDYVAAAPGLLLNDDHAAGTTPVASLVAGPAHGTVVVRADGSFTYDPVGTYKGEDAFTYRVRAGGRWSEPATVAISVGKAKGAAPAARPDSYDARGGERLLVKLPGVKGNDVDPDGNGILVHLLEDAAHGTLELRLDGSFLYTPDPGFRGTDTFTYAASDGRLRSVPTRVELHVTSLLDGYVDRVHRDLLGRPATDAETTDWVHRIESGAASRTTFVRTLVDGHEHVVRAVEHAFVTFLGRPAEPAEVAEWTARVEGGLALGALPVELVGSPRGVTAANTTSGGTVDDVFAVLVGREPTEAQRSRWVRAIERGEGVTEMARTLYGSNDGRRIRVLRGFDAVLGRTPTATEASTWATRLASRDDTELVVALVASAEHLAATAP